MIWNKRMHRILDHKNWRDMFWVNNFMTLFKQLIKSAENVTTRLLPRFVKTYILYANFWSFRFFPKCFDSSTGSVRSVWWHLLSWLRGSASLLTNTVHLRHYIYRNLEIDSILNLLFTPIHSSHSINIFM